MIYDKADKAIKAMNRRNLKAFNRLKLADFDELNIIREIDELYRSSSRYAEKQYLEIARDAYITAMHEAHYKGNPEKAIDDDWVLDMLEEVDPVTLYVFTYERERKKQRLIEALSVAHDKVHEIDKALRYWTLQLGQYADNSVAYAREQAFEDAGIRRVRWVTQHDERVCKTCDERDGHIYRIGNIPQTHWGCRCILEPVFN